MSKISNTCFILFSSKMEVIRTLIHKTLVREGDPDQTASLEAVWSGSALNFKLFGQATSTPKNYVH